MCIILGFVLVFIFSPMISTTKIFSFNLPKLSLISSSTDNRLISSSLFVLAEDKLKIELLFMGPKNKKRELPPLILLHGSGGGAWIFHRWQEYFAQIGIDSYAVSLRGSYGTGMKDFDTVISLTKIISDLKCVLIYIRKKYSNNANGRPIVLGHSFGGLVLSTLLEDKSVRSNISGAVWMAALPPSGQQSMALRFIYTRFINTVNIIRGFAFGAAQKSPVVNKLLFYDQDTPESDVLRYMTRLQKDAQYPLNFTEIENNLPSKKRTKTGEAYWLKQVLEDKNQQFKRLVFGSNDDYIVDPEAIKENAKFVGVKPILINGPGHNIMLGEKWQVAADTIKDWLLKEF